MREQSSQRKKGKQAGHTTLQIYHLARELPSIASLGSSSFCRSFLSLPIPTRVLVAAGQAIAAQQASQASRAEQASQASRAEQAAMSFHPREPTHATRATAH